MTLNPESRTGFSPETVLMTLLDARSGHFLTESGYHTDYWFDVAKLFQNLELLKIVTNELAYKLSQYSIDLICGPMTGGARVAEMIGEKLDVKWIPSERELSYHEGSISNVVYRIPENMRSKLLGLRVAVVDDIIDAGSAVKGSLAELEELGAIPIVIAGLLVKGILIYPFAAEKNLPVEKVTAIANNMWEPAECLLCAKGQIFESVV